MATVQIYQRRFQYISTYTHTCMHAHQQHCLTQRYVFMRAYIQHTYIHTWPQVRFTSDTVCYKFMLLRIQTALYVCRCICMYACMQACAKNIYIYIYILIYYTHTPVICVHTQIYTHIHTQIHTYIYTYTQIENILRLNPDIRSPEELSVGQHVCVLPGICPRYH